MPIIGQLLRWDNGCVAELISVFSRAANKLYTLHAEVFGLSGFQ